MGILKGLFGKKGTEAERRTEAAAALEEIGSGSQLSPDAVLKALRKRQRNFYAWWRIGGEMHEDFRRIAQTALDRLEAADMLPAEAVEVVPWETWDAATVGDVIDKAAATPAAALLLTAPAKRAHGNALAEVQALRALAEADTVLVAIDEEDLLVDCAFLRSLGGDVAPDHEEVAQDLMDAAKARGRKVQTVW